MSPRLASLRVDCCTIPPVQEGSPLDWLPKSPPSNERIEKAWEALFNSTFAQVNRTVTNARIRELLEHTTSANLNVSIIPRQHITEWKDGYCPNDQRPRFYPPVEEESEAIGNPDLEPNSGNLMEHDDAIRAPEEHGIYMSFHMREIFIPHDLAQMYSHQRLTLHPDMAMQMIQSIGWKNRRTVAGALIHKFINANQRMENDEEFMDGGASPTWRDIESDPSLDALRFGNIPDIYKQMVNRKRR